MVCRMNIFLESIMKRDHSRRFLRFGISSILALALICVELPAVATGSENSVPSFELTLSKAVEEAVVQLQHYVRQCEFFDPLSINMERLKKFIRQSTAMTDNAP